MAKKDSVGLQKTDWTSRFNLVGKVKLSDFTFTMDKHSEKSDWVFNQLQLDVDCGEKSGTVRCELMGGYGANRDNVCYVHGKDEDNRDDFSNQYQIAWEDRLDNDILKDIGDMCFLRAGLEKDTKGNIVTSKFLSPYDFIAYLQENLAADMAVNIKGQLRYTVYNDTIQCRKEIQSIYIADEESKNYQPRATFTQTVLMDSDSCTKAAFDKEKSVLINSAYVLEKMKEYNGNDLTEGGKIRGGQFVPLHLSMEFPVDITTDEGKKKFASVLKSNIMFKVKPGKVDQATFEGHFVESGATVQPTEDDLTDDMKELIEMGVMDLDEALGLCADNGGKERKMVIDRPAFKTVGDDDNKQRVMLRFEEKFVAEDLTPAYIYKKEEDEDEGNVPFAEDDADTDDADLTAEGGDDDWLDML